ncbi:hypothetical protein LGZ99_10850 [Photorhabdus temperata]|uniref:hypothetical protein n=1 Tax=Photorhabdus temperata TaxID=574560 RepID=UPI0021D4A08C|nr:hypothetical protein [Photorhabdus temperata]MCT8347698.1 hypothetical protein [Photorhabdus temperata]
MSEKDFRNIIWQSVIACNVDRKFGMPARRKSTFIEIAKKRAKQMLYGVDESLFDPEVVAKLEEDNLIYRDSQKSVISPMYDVLEDWALEEFISKEYIGNAHDIRAFLTAIGNEPAVNRAFRLWLFQQIKFEVVCTDFISSLLLSNDIENYWKDEVISAIIQSELPEMFLNNLSKDLLGNNCHLLIRFFSFFE